MTTREAVNQLVLPFKEVMEADPATLVRKFARNRWNASIYENAAYLVVLIAAISVAIGDLPWWAAITAFLVLIVTATISWATKGTIPARLVAERELEWATRPDPEDIGGVMATHRPRSQHRQGQRAAMSSVQRRSGCVQARH